MHGPGAAGGDQHEPAGVMTTLGADLLHGMEELLLEEGDDAGGSVIDRQS
jgi:hypothetical protein